MDNQSPSDAFQRVVEANEEICLRYEADFNSRIANTDFAPEGSRISELERIWHKARTDADAAYSRFTEDLIKGINESEVIESKKESTHERG